MDENTRPKTIKDRAIILYYESIPIISMNLVWFLLSIFILPAIPALGALYYASNKIVREGTADWSTFFEGFKKYFWTSWKWGLIYIVVNLVFAFNLWFYANIDAIWGAILQVVFIWLLLTWLILNMYTFPLLIMQENRSMRTALRNSFVIVMRRPGKTLLLALISTIMIGVSTLLVIPLWVVLTAALLTYLATKNTIETIEFISSQQKEKDSEEMDV